MKFFTPVLCFVTGIFVCSGCASIVSKSKWPVTIHSEPRGARITITDKKGIEVYSGLTPATMKLKSGAGFFAKQTYNITFTLDGYQTKTAELKCKLNGWYIGNLLFGGVIGLLIVDPATGAMYKVEKDFIDAKLDSATGVGATTSAEGTLSLRILEKSQISEEMAKHLVPVN
jgi:hypothetical protein